MGQGYEAQETTLGQDGAAAQGELIDLADARVRAGDHIVRGTAADGQVRAFAVTARASVQEMHERHQTSPVVTAALGRLLMAGQMMGAMSKSDDELITLPVRGEGPVGRITVTANNRGQAKGFANHPHVWLPLNGQGKLDVGGAVAGPDHEGTLLVVHDLPGIEPYSSEVPLETGEIGDDLVSYFALSDQVPTSVGVGVLVDRDSSVRQAGGFVVQLMPGCSEEVVALLEGNLSHVSSVTSLMEDGMGPTQVLEHVLEGLSYKELDAMPAEFHCGCDRERASRAVLALGQAEIEDMVAKGEPADVYCHFCGERYRFEPDELRELIASSEDEEPA